MLGGDRRRLPAAEVGDAAVEIGGYLFAAGKEFELAEERQSGDFDCSFDAHQLVTELDLYAVCGLGADVADGDGEESTVEDEVYEHVRIALVNCGSLLGRFRRHCAAPLRDLSSPTTLQGFRSRFREFQWRRRCTSAFKTGPDHLHGHALMRFHRPYWITVLVEQDDRDAGTLHVAVEVILHPGP